MRYDDMNKFFGTVFYGVTCLDSNAVQLHLKILVSFFSLLTE